MASGSFGFRVSEDNGYVVKIGFSEIHPSGWYIHVLKGTALVVATRFRSSTSTVLRG